LQKTSITTSDQFLKHSLNFQQNVFDPTMNQVGIRPFTLGCTLKSELGPIQVLGRGNRRDHIDQTDITYLFCAAILADVLVILKEGCLWLLQRVCGRSHAAGYL
jgi:hypothetical protein